MKEIATSELYSLLLFSNTELKRIEDFDDSVKKYYIKVSEKITDELNERINRLCPEIAYLIQ